MRGGEETRWGKGRRGKGAGRRSAGWSTGVGKGGVVLEDELGRGAEPWKEGACGSCREHLLDVGSLSKGPDGWIWRLGGGWTRRKVGGCGWLDVDSEEDLDRGWRRTEMDGWDMRPRN